MLKHLIIRLCAAAGVAEVARGERFQMAEFRVELDLVCWRTIPARVIPSPVCGRGISLRRETGERFLVVPAGPGLLGMTHLGKWLK